MSGFISGFAHGLLGAAEGGTPLFVGARAVNSSGPSVSAANLISSGAQAGDLIIYSGFCNGSSSSSGAPSTGTVLISNSFSDFSEGFYFNVNYIASWNGSQSLAFGGANYSKIVGNVLIFRGHNAVAPIDASNSTTGSGAGNPPAVTPTVDNCIIGFITAGDVYDATPGTVSNYTLPTNYLAAENDTFPYGVMTACGYRILSGGAGVEENPAAFSSWASGNKFAAVTFAIKPSLE